MMLRTTAFSPLSNSIGPSTFNARHGSAAYSLTFASNAPFPYPTALDSRFTLCFKSGVFYSSLQQFRQSHLNSLVISGNGLGVSAVNKKGGKGGVGVVESDDFDDGDDSDYDDEDFVGDDEDDDEGELIPFEQMNKWYMNKPRGFGEGKVYDTSIEDKLLEEIQQSKEAQAANLNKLKNDSRNAGSNKNEQKKEVVQSEFRVRLANLPKKKNIHRDLKAAFQGIPGITDIIPAVSGNKKTRDPICKGFAFVDFKCEEDAVRFVQLCSKQTIAFGKIQKQIKCDLLNSKSSNAACLESSENFENAPQVNVPSLEEYVTESSSIDDLAISSWDVITSDNSVELGKQLYGAEREHVGENLEATAELNVDDEDEDDDDDDDDDSMELGFTSKTNSSSFKKVDRNGSNELTLAAKSKAGNVPKKKPHSREKAKKLPKLDIPGSAKRLKIREKAVLSDVFSKYGSKVGLASKDNL